MCSVGQSNVHKKQRKREVLHSLFVDFFFVFMVEKRNLYIFCIAHSGILSTIVRVSAAETYVHMHEPMNSLPSAPIVRSLSFCLRTKIKKETYIHRIRINGASRELILWKRNKIKKKNFRAVMRRPKRSKSG